MFVRCCVVFNAPTADPESDAAAAAEDKEKIQVKSELGIEEELLQWVEEAQVNELTMTVKEKKAEKEVEAGGLRSRRFRMQIIFDSFEDIPESSCAAPNAK